MRNGKSTLRAWALCFVIAGTACAQYEAPREYSPLEARYFSAGVMARDFAPRSGYTGGDSLAIRYSAWMPMIGFHQEPVDALFGYTRYTLKNSTRSAVFFATTVSNDFPVMRGPSSLALPIILAMDYTKAESAGAERDQFNIASVGLGAGIKLHVMTPGMVFSAQAGGIYHYSFEGFSTGTGSSFAVIAEASLLLRSVHLADGLVVGYRFRHQNWSIDDGRLNYRVTTHGPYLGVLL